MSQNNLPRFEPHDIVRHYGQPALVLAEPTWVVDCRQDALWKHPPHWRYVVRYLSDGTVMNVSEDALTDAEYLPMQRRNSFRVIDGGLGCNA